MGEIQLKPTPTEDRSKAKSIFSLSPYTLPISKKAYKRSDLSLPAPGKGAKNSVFKVNFLGPPTVRPETSLGPSVPAVNPLTEPKPPEL